MKILTWLDYVLSSLLLKLGKNPADMSWDRRGVRQAIGGRWGLWEVCLLGGTMTAWMQSPCCHYPPPPLVNSTEPLNTEEW